MVTKRYLEPVQRFLGEERGQTLVEYGLILVGISLAVTGLLFALGAKLADTFTVITNSI